MLQECRTYFFAEMRLSFHLLARPNAHPQNPLDFLRRIKPATTIAKPMSREIVGKFVRSESSVGKNVIGCKRFPWFYLAATEMTPGIGLVEHVGPLVSG